MNQVPNFSPRTLADATGDSAAIGRTPWSAPARHLSADDFDRPDTGWKLVGTAAFIAGFILLAVVL